MKRVCFLALIVVVVSCSAKVQKSNNISMDWGKFINDLDGNYVPNGVKISGCDGYVNLEENFNFQGLTAHSVNYGFCDDKLTSIQLGLFTKDLNAIVEYLTSNYDRPDIGLNNGVVTYKWTKGLMEAVLLYDKNNGKGIDLTMKNLNPNLEAAAVVEDKVVLESRTNTVSAAIPATMMVVEPCPVETLYDGFDCELWGTPLNEMQGDYVKSKNNTPKLDPYDKVNGKMNYQGIETATITYCFKNGLFQGVNMAIYNKDIDRIVKLWTDSYGVPKVVDGAGFFTNYEWHLDGLLLTITYLHKKEDGIGVALGILCENNNFKVRKPAVQPQKTSSSATTVKSISKQNSTPAPAKGSSSTESDSRSSARDRLRDKSDTPAAPEVSKEKKVKEPEIDEVPEEAPVDDTGTKSKRELLRERKDKK